jgi:GGDEF domain-containing protein
MRSITDLYHFKAFNHRYGHAAGDELQETVGAAIRAGLRKGDAAYRHGDDEIILLLGRCVGGSGRGGKDEGSPPAQFSDPPLDIDEVLAHRSLLPTSVRIPRDLAENGRRESSPLVLVVVFAGEISTVRAEISWDSRSTGQR